jgi:hypothetical protein
LGGIEGLLGTVSSHLRKTQISQSRRTAGKELYLSNLVSQVATSSGQYIALVREVKLLREINQIIGLAIFQTSEIGRNGA